MPDTPKTSRPTSPLHVAIEEGEAIDAIFDPAAPGLTPENSVLVGIDTLPAYLDRALACLGLHVEARTSFIT
jgi:hypothetical protein